jgi:ribose 5-phosphate isomerase B
MVTHGLRVGLGCDHAGFLLKQRLIPFLVEKGVKIKDFGTHSEESTDYADAVHPLCSAIEAGEHDLGIVICGSGNGVNMTANKHQGIRSALCWKIEIARLARAHNNANVLAMAARFISDEIALQIVDIFLKTDFDGGRHTRRIGKIAWKDENDDFNQDVDQMEDMHDDEL